jgi:hypothetical protein
MAHSTPECTTATIAQQRALHGDAADMHAASRYCFPANGTDQLGSELIIDWPRVKLSVDALSASNTANNSQCQHARHGRIVPERTSCPENSLLQVGRCLTLLSPRRETTDPCTASAVSARLRPCAQLHAPPAVGFVTSNVKLQGGRYFLAGCWSHREIMAFAVIQRPRRFR